MFSSRAWPTGQHYKIQYLAGALAALMFSAGAIAAQPAVKAPSFQQDIHPIFEKHCLDCHAGWFPKASLRLDTLENVRKGGRSGPLLVPGEPDKGWLMRRLKLPGGKLKMPPGAARLSVEELNHIEEWIRQGAR